MPKITAAIFDMDGLLIDTEPLWRRVEIDVFGSLGLHISEEQCMETMGVRVGEVVEIWFRRHPWEGATTAEITRRIIESVVAHVRSEGVPKAGVCDALRMVHDEGMPIAIASSSSLELIRAVVERLNIGEYISVMCTADDEPAGKPDPAVYLSAAARVDVPPEQCVAFEDSPNGVLSAKAAGMYCIAVPDPFLAADPRMSHADAHLNSLESFTPALLDGLRQFGRV